MAGVRPFQLRKIGHVVLNVTDIEASVRFYTEVLGLRSATAIRTAWSRAAWSSCATTPTTTAWRWSAARRRSPASSLNHFAFEVGTLDEVFRARAWLREHGVPIVFEGRRRAGCQVAVEFRDPDGNNLEIYWNIDQVGTTGEVRPPSEWRQARTLEDAVANPVAGQELPPVPDR